MELRLDGRVALITGAARGIGLAMARALAASGAAVAIQDIEVAIAQAEAAALVKQGAKAIALPGDLADLAVAGGLVQQTVKQLGGLHILINNAGIQVPGPWTEDSAETIERQFRVNLTAPILLAQGAAKIFREQRFGRIINLGSIQQIKGNPHMLAYSMSKAALENMTRALARDLAKHNVTVNLIAPGWYSTWRTRGDFASPEEKVEKGLKIVPLGRIGEPTDAAGMTVLLCSDAGSYMTGQTLFIDGGLSVK